LRRVEMIRCFFRQRSYYGTQDGYLFTTKAGRLLDQRNSVKALHGAGNRGGFHAFRRFRFTLLRGAGVPENLIKQWLGHSQNLMDLYAAQLRYVSNSKRSTAPEDGSACPTLCACGHRKTDGLHYQIDVGNEQTALLRHHRL
jgi:integrase